MELYLLRHGATPGNLRGAYIGVTDEPLAEEGVAAARQMTGTYPDPDRLWVSPMRRARETAALLFPGCPQFVVDDFRELDFGTWEGKTWEEVQDPSVFDRWLSGAPSACYPGGEMQEAFARRTGEAFWDVVRQGEDAGLRRCAIVAHGGVTMALMHQFAVPGRETFFSWMSQNCGGFRVAADLSCRRLTLLEELGR